MKTFHVRSTHVYTYKENCNIIIDIKNKMSKKRKKKFSIKSSSISARN